MNLTYGFNLESIIANPVLNHVSSRPIGLVGCGIYTARAGVFDKRGQVEKPLLLGKRGPVKCM